ncbi:CD48 antigen-like isoform 3-T3 [Trichechus inunguis]
MDSLLTRWYFTQILMLKFSLILGVQTVKELHSPCTLNRTVGESAQLQLNSSLPLTIREIEWSWISEDEKNQLLVSWRPNTTDPAWYDFEDKYKHRFSLTELAFLSIRNLTAEMSGLYEAKIKFSSGKFQEDIVRLCVYEPIPQPQVLIHSSSKTSGWCNFTLECGTPGATENLTVTWLGKGLPGHLEKRGTQEPTPNSRIVSLSLPLSQVNTHVICVVSNPADQKNATLDLGSICLWRGSLWSKWLWKGIFATVLVVILGAGVWIWKRRKTETEKDQHQEEQWSYTEPRADLGGEHCLRDDQDKNLRRTPGSRAHGDIVVLCFFCFNLSLWYLCYACSNQKTKTNLLLLS